MYLQTNVPFQYTISGNREQVFLLYYKDFFEQICSDVQFISPPEEVGEFLLHLLKFKCWYYETAMKDGNEDAINAMLPDKLPKNIQKLYDKGHD